MSGERTLDASSRMPLENAPDAIEPIRAWRGWRASADESTDRLTLRSLTDGGTRWKPGEALTAHCAFRDHAAPNAQCSCGIYAHKTRKAAIKHARAVDRAVVGEVELWGKVVEHQHGYRAQYARPRALWVPHFPNDAPSTSLGLHHYGLPVGIYDTRTGRVLGADEIDRAVLRDSRRALPLKIARCLGAVAQAVVAAIVLAVAAVIVLAFAAILLPFMAAIGPAIRHGNIGDLLKISVVDGPPVFMLICMCRAD